MAVIYIRLKVTQPWTRNVPAVVWRRYNCSDIDTEYYNIFFQRYLLSISLSFEYFLHSLYLQYLFFTYMCWDSHRSVQAVTVRIELVKCPVQRISLISWIFSGIQLFVLRTRCSGQISPSTHIIHITWTPTTISSSFTRNCLCSILVEKTYDFSFHLHRVENTRQC